MTAVGTTDTKPIRTGREIGPGEEICHIVEPDDPDTALCGKDVTDYPWNPPWPFCLVCLDLARGRGLGA